MKDSNLDRLIAAAQLLRPLLGELVFVGGSVTGLLITDEAGGDPRTTLDVDAIAEITTYAEYTKFGDRLRALGFAEDATEGAPLCRWLGLGFSNRWYRAAMESSITRRILNDLEIRIVAAPFFMATKLEAFKGRGRGDFFGSQDLEDVVAVIEGRAALLTEVKAEDDRLLTYIGAEVRELLGTSGFLDALPGYLLPDAASQSRIGVVLKRLQELAAL